jgi:hypothetical protein
MKIRILLLAGFIWPACSVAQPWSLMSCGPEGERGWSPFEHAVRTAAPGSTIFVPRPYPRSDREVIEDFLYHYKDAYSRGFDEKQLREAIANQKVSFSVLRVENWTTLRCGTNRKQDFYDMVRVFAAGSGTELARAVLDDSGLMVMLENFTSSPKNVDKAALRKVLIPEAHDALQEVATRFKVVGDSPEYVMSFGTIPCSFTRPCLAFRHGAGSYLYSRLSEELFQIPEGARRLTQGKDVGTLETNTRLQKELPEDQRFVSLGGDSWAIATKVPAPP